MASRPSAHPLLQVFLNFKCISIHHAHRRFDRIAFDEARQQAVETGAPSAQQGKEKEEEENKAYLSPVFKVRGALC